MTWQIDVFDEFERGTFASIVESAVAKLPEYPTMGQIEKAVADAIDERVVHYWTMLEVIQACGMTGDAYDLAYETFVGEVRSSVYDMMEEEEQ